MRMTTGMLTAPSWRFVILASCEVIWSNAGKTNPSNWISHTGRYPRNASPTAVPTMPDSASGVSRTRCSPKSFCNPSVIRKTPPSLPMSSPRMTTLSSSSIALRRPMLSALPSVTVCFVVAISVTRRVRTGVSGIGVRVVETGKVIGELGPLTLGLGVWVGVDVIEHPVGCRFGHRHAEGAETRGQLGGLGVDPVEEGLVSQPSADQVHADPFDRVEQLPGLGLVGQ